MKHFKLLSVFMALLIAFSVISTASVYADEADVVNTADTSANENEEIKKFEEILHSRSLSMDMTDSGYVVKYISKYAGVGMDYDVIESYQELMPELNAMLNGQNRKFAEEILKEAGII